MLPLKILLNTYREMAPNEREKGFYFELLIKTFLENDPKYDFEKVWLWPDWAKSQGLRGQDAGIDLVAVERDSGAVWAVQCKFYGDDTTIYKKHLDSFFTASGKKPFDQRLIVLTGDKLSSLAQEALEGQRIPCATLNLADLEDSPIDWSGYQPGLKPDLRPRKTPRPHQEKAIASVRAGLEDKDRGKLLMACGTGKTFTTLKIAEEMAGAGRMVLFLVPSLSLLAQTLGEWTAESAVPLRAFAVCSDSSTGRGLKNGGDLADIRPSDLAYPATTNPKRLAEKITVEHLEKMTVVFATYHSLEVIAEAQKNHGLGEFALIICDEAHRTTGVTLAGEDESSFVRVHDNGFIKAKKRLYMTATPRVFGDVVKSKAREAEAVLCSMDDESLYGETLYCLNFTEAVHRDLLSDYKVLVLAVDEAHVSRRVQRMLADEDGELKLDDAAKIIGCWKALSKEKLETPDDPEAMSRAVAFCRDIKNSKKVAALFKDVVEEYLLSESLEAEMGRSKALACDLRHVDGTMNSAERRVHLEWLKDETDDVCRVLTNARCLSEGVDVPSLDAVLFFNPRKSQVDVVQAVGRVMRKAPGKRRGYVILPIGVPAGVSAEEALNDNEKYRVVWQILQALRSHDDNFDDWINKIDLGVDVSGKMEVVAVTDAWRTKRDESGEALIGGGSKPSGDGDDDGSPPAERQIQNGFSFDIGEFEKAVYAKIVKKCGNRQYWEEWAGDVAKIAQTHITRIKAALAPGSPARPTFDEFLAEIRDDLNDGVGEDEAIEMLAQHLITRPVFEALFEGYSFAAHNPVSQALQKVLNVLGREHLEKEAEPLEKFYESVRRRARGIDNAPAKQRIILELYDKFFRNAFPKMTDRLGIVYTPVEVVDFIIHSVNDLLREEFDQNLAGENVHILDPFTGTGTFITRLLQSGLIDKEALPRKYAGQIHANEIVLLAYYIAAINIESVYHGLMGGDYQPFEGLCLTDTFQLYEKEDLVSHLLEDNSARRNRQKTLDIQVIIGNPPYSAGQTSANDNNQNQAYPALDERIRQTYAKYSKAANKNALYDSYIRAIRWAGDRIGDSGVIGLVTNAGYVDGNAMDGLRKCLAEEFSSLYIFHLRGNQRTSGDLSRKEGGKIFGSGSRAPIAISFLVKNPKATQRGRIFFHDIGDYLNREDKLNIIAEFKSVGGITRRGLWQTLTPDKHGDWLNQRDQGFEEFISIGDKKDTSKPTIFKNYSCGLKTQRDSWCYNFSQAALANNMERMIAYYNSEVERLAKYYPGRPRKDMEKLLDSFVGYEPAKISWSRSLKQYLTKNKFIYFNESGLTPSLYRPFVKQWLYFDRDLNEMVYQMPRIFPAAGAENKVICVTGLGASKEFSALITNVIPNLHTLDTGQCFPLYLYEPLKTAKSGSLLDALEPTEGCARQDGISDEGLEYFQQTYPTEKISKEEIFYYIYGLLHSPEYRVNYADNLKRELPRIPRVKSAADFRAFSLAGRTLAGLHLNYECAELYPVKFNRDLSQLSAPEDFKVAKMRWAKSGKEPDKSTVIYNSKITFGEIPLKAYDYIVNGKSALEWLMERYAITTDKASGLVNDANQWSLETAHNPRYPLELFQRLITVSLETLKIVQSLPGLGILKEPVD